MSKDEKENFVPVSVNINKSIFEAEKEYKMKYGDGKIKEAVYAVIFSSPLMDVFSSKINYRPMILLTKRSETNEWGAGTYAPIGGKIEWDDFEVVKKIAKFGMSHSLAELFIQTITRELREEIEKDIPCMTQFQYIGSYDDKQTGFRIHVLSGFLVRSGDDLEEQLSGKIGIRAKIKEELSNAEWIPLEDIISSLEKENGLEMMPGSKNVIKYYLKNKK
ncbi:MAG: NUDIX hydrolase [Candidatus Parvarchaeota archaeon]|nr:NUDIX hydrolase [Candidatus Jingweiarchaeum tengchongense]MCW1304654.1 NUDIX hydrolase [Candidatus Jingweiarchaeum tengchongense]MCW1309153.1 NUDIX hydrolase [Candidatus Jingweiarchaeum tengchongense]